MDNLGEDEKTTVTTQPPNPEDFLEEEAQTVRAEGFSIEEMSKFLNQPSPPNSAPMSSDLWSAPDQWNSPNWTGQPANYPAPPPPIETPVKKKSSSLVYFISVAIILALLGGVVGLVIIPNSKKDKRGSSAQAKKQKKEKIITLELETKPSGATVWIDGKKHPEKTPTVINVIEGREVNIQLYKKGHKVIDFKWIAKKPDKREFILAPQEDSAREKEDKKKESEQAKSTDSPKKIKAKKSRRRGLPSLPPPPSGPRIPPPPPSPNPLPAGSPAYMNTGRVRLFIRTKPPGAKVVINKNRVLRGKTPLSFSWPKGEKVEISIQKYGYQEVYFIWKAQQNETKVIELIPYSWYNP